MEINKAGFISLLSLRTSGDRGWYHLPNCLFCNGKEKMAILLVPYGNKKPHFHCFKCMKAGSLRFLAKYIGKPELVSGEYIAPMDIGMSIDTTNSNATTPVCKPPIGFRRTKDHPYLDERMISHHQRELYKFGFSKVDPNVGSDYLTTLVEEGGVCVGYVSRSVMPKKWIDEYNNTNDKEYPRYKNSESDFENIVMGIDEISIDSTHTVVLVEGKFDKFAIDRKLCLYDSDEIKCGVSFGTKLSEVQSMKMAMRGIDNLIILYDSGTVDKSKKVSKVASSYFKSVRIGSLPNGDPDESTQDEILSALEGAKSVTEYSLSELDTDKYEL